MKLGPCLGALLCLGLTFICSIAFATLAITSLVSAGVLPDLKQPTTPTPLVVPVVPNTPAPCPDCPGPNCPAPAPNKPRKPWGPRGCEAVGLAGVERGLVHDGPTHNGIEVQADLPADQLKRNINSKGLGCCVFRATEYQARNQNIPELWDLPEKMVKDGIEGGGCPEKFSQVCQRYAPGARYIQIQNGDWELVKLALKTGRMPNITLGKRHMVNIVCLTNGVGALRDNNLTAENEIIWGSEETIKQACGGAHFWAVILLAPRPPAPPRSVANVWRAGHPRHRLTLVDDLQHAPYLPGAYTWKGWSNDRDQFGLWRDGKQAGTYTSAEDYYQELTAPGAWGRRWHRPPVPLPREALARLEDMPPGVRTEAIGNVPRYSYCGQEVTRDVVQAVLEDDTNKLSLTAIGDPAETARVKADLDKPENADFRNRVVFQAYDRNNWAISPARYGFDNTGHPTIYLETPGGSVLWHTQSYDPATTLQTLRQKDPNYNPNNDPGVKPDSTPVISDGIGNLMSWIGGGLLGLILMTGIGLFGGLGSHLLIESLEP